MVYRFFDKKSSGSGVDAENSAEKKFIHLLKTIFGVLM